MPTSTDETPTTGADTEDENKVEVKSEAFTEKVPKSKQFAKRSKSLGTLSDSKPPFAPNRRLSRRKTEGGIGIRVVWRTSPTTDLETLSRVLGIPARNRSVSPMKRPESIDNVFSEYYDPLAFHARLPANSQGTPTALLGIPAAHSSIPISQRRNTLKKDTVTMPSVKKLLSIFERSAATHNDTKNSNLDPKVLPVKEHQIKFPNSDKDERLNQSLPGIVNDVYGQYKSKDYSEVYEDDVAATQKPKIIVTKTYSLPNSESENRSRSKNNNSSNLCNLNSINHEKKNLNENEVPLRAVDGQMYLEANKVAKPTSSVSLLKQKWESFVKERMKSKKVSKSAADINKNDDPIVLPTKQSEVMTNEPLNKEFHRYPTDTFRRSAPFERNTTTRRSVKNMAKKYESMRESSPNSKDVTEEKNKMAAVEVKKKIPLTPSKSLDNLKLLETSGEPWLIDIKIQDNQRLEVKKEITVSKIDATDFLGLERKPSVRDLKKKFEVIENKDQKIVKRSMVKKVEPVTGYSPNKLQETDINDLNNSLEEPKIQQQTDRLEINGDLTDKPKTSHVATDTSNKSLVANAKLEKNLEITDPDIPQYENNLKFDDIKINKDELLGSKTVTKKSSIKIELSLSPPNPQKKSKLSLMPVSALIDTNNYSPEKVAADSKSKEKTNKNRFSKEEKIVLLKENVYANVGGEANSRFEPDINPLLFEESSPKLSATASPTLNSDFKSVKTTVLITELSSPAQKNSADVGTRKKARLAQKKSEDSKAKIDHSKFDEQTSKAMSTTSTSPVNKSEVKKIEDWNDNLSSKQSEVKNKISESDVKVTRSITDKEVLGAMQSEPKNVNAESKNKNFAVNKNSDIIPVTDKKDQMKNINSDLVGEQASQKLSSSKKSSKNVPTHPDVSTDNLSGTEAKTNVNKIDSEIRKQGLTPVNKSRNQPPVPTERTKYSESPTNVPDSSYYTVYNSSSESKSRLTSDVKEEKVLNSPKDSIMDFENHAKVNVKSDGISHIIEQNGTNREESLAKDPSKGGSRFRSRKAARRAYTDSLLKHLVNSETSPSRLQVPKDPEIAHPNELHNLLYRKNLPDSTLKEQSVDSAVKKSIPSFLVRKTRSKSATSITFANKVRELKPDELKFFKDLTPLSAYPIVSKDRASTVATSSPTSEGESTLSRTSSFERSSMRDSQKYRKLHSDEMKFFGLNYTHN